jgi:hypothetical protein
MIEHVAGNHRIKRTLRFIRQENMSGIIMYDVMS